MRRAMAWFFLGILALVAIALLEYQGVGGERTAPPFEEVR